jgi:DtxR family transcriptional regulator, Mn-dependent transcriptional regulator
LSFKVIEIFTAVKKLGQSRGKAQPWRLSGISKRGTIFNAMRLSHTEENYLKAIYKLAQNGNAAVSTNDLSAALQNRAASVTDMIGKLSAKGLIAHQKYRGASLTQKGNDVALRVIRKHRLWECFLVQTLGFNWDEIHEVAEQLEHIQSERLTERLEAFLGFPTNDPHGEPIPDANGRLHASRHPSISEARAGDKVKVSMVGREHPEFLKYLDAQRITIGSVLHVVSVEGGAVLVKAARRSVSLDKETARHIFVQHLEP